MVFTDKQKEHRIGADQHTGQEQQDAFQDALPRRADMGHPRAQGEYDDGVVAGMPHAIRSHSRSNAGMPGATACASAAAFQLVRRMQPCDWVLPTVDGSGVPWIP